MSHLRSMGGKIQTLEFNIEGDNYRDMIKQLRAKAQAKGKYSHNRPVLPVGGPVEWIDVTLIFNKHNLTLRLQRDNLYLRGYRAENRDTRDNRWLEFGCNNGRATHLIEGSTFLGFGGGYHDLIGAQRNMVGLKITYHSITVAIGDLAAGKRESGKTHLTNLILVICEAVRFDAIMEVFATPLLKKRDEATVHEWMHQLISNWGDISLRLLLADAAADFDFRFPTTSNQTLRERIANALDAQRDIGILKGYPLSRLATRFKREAPSDVRVAYAPPGLQMMEVIEAKIHDISTTISGKITVDDGLGSQVLFDGRQELNAGGGLSLNSLTRAISACQSVEISYDLTAENPGLAFLGSISWDIFQGNDNDCALQVGEDDDVEIPREGPKLLVAKGKRQHEEYQGRFTLSYQIFPMACQISWEVKIVDGDGHDRVNIHGRLTASYSYGGHDYNFELFRRSDENNAEVRVGGDLTLTRSIMAVPFDTNLTVEADLRDSRDHHLIGGSKTHRIGKVLFRNKVSGRFPFMKSEHVGIWANWNLTSMD